MPNGEDLGPGPEDPMKTQFSSPDLSEAIDPAAAVTKPSGPSKAKKAGVIATIAGLLGSAGLYINSQRDNGNNEPVGGTNETPTTVRMPGNTVETAAPSVEFFDGSNIKVGDVLEVADHALLIGPGAVRRSSTQEADGNEIHAAADQTQEVNDPIVSKQVDGLWLAYRDTRENNKQWTYVKLDAHNLANIEFRTGANDAKDQLTLDNLAIKDVTVKSVDSSINEANGGHIEVTGLGGPGEQDWPVPIADVVSES